jgi:anti-anti-sigma factor
LIGGPAPQIMTGQFCPAGRGWQGAMLMSDLGLVVEVRNQNRVLHISGEIDALTAPELQREIAALPPDGDLILDFSDVPFMDRTGIDLLVKLLRDDRSTIRLRHVRPSVLRIKQICGLTRHPKLVIEPSESRGRTPIDVFAGQAPCILAAEANEGWCPPRSSKSRSACKRAGGFDSRPPPLQVLLASSRPRSEDSLRLTGLKDR